SSRAPVSDIIAADISCWGNKMKNAKSIDRRMMIKSVLGAAGAAIVLPAILSRTTRGDSATASAPATTQAPPPPMPFDTDKIEVINLAAGLELLTGPGGNIAVLHGKDGTLLIDCGVPSRSKEILKAVDQIRGKPDKDAAPDAPLKVLINTH